jgi:hypothetical protein
MSRALEIAKKLKFTRPGDGWKDSKLAQELEKKKQATKAQEAAKQKQAKDGWKKPSSGTSSAILIRGADGKLHRNPNAKIPNSLKK